MKVLFVCRQNVGRSQMAKAFYNQLTGSNYADSAGTRVDFPGQTLLERKNTSSSKNFFLLDAMDAAGLDISGYTRKQITEDMMEDYDLVVSMAESDSSPEWMIKSPKYVYWDIADPRGQDLEATIIIRDQIRNKVSQLAQ